MRITKPHGLSIEERDKIAHNRKLLSLSVLPNEDGYYFYGHHLDGWRSECVIKKDAKGLHYISGDATYDQLIGWSVKSANITYNK